MSDPLRTSKSRQEPSRILRATDGWITIEDAAAALGTDRTTAAKRLARWTEQGWLRRVQRGHYAPIPLETAEADVPLEEPWAVIPHLLPLGYVGGWSAAHHWDLTEQLFRDICVFAPGRSRRMERGGSKYAVFPMTGERDFGVGTHWVGSTRVRVSDPERTLVDMLAQPRSGPGIQNASDCLATYMRSSSPQLDKLLDYAAQLGNGAAFKRLGFLLEREQLGSPDALEAHRAALSQGLAKLDPNVPCPRVITRWRLRVPDSWTSVEND